VRGSIAGVRLHRGDVALTNTPVSQAPAASSASAYAFAHAVQRFVVRVKVVGALRRPLRAGFTTLMLCHMGSFAASVLELRSVVHNGQVSACVWYVVIVRQAVNKPDSITTNDMATLLLETLKPIYVEPYTVCAPMGRLCGCIGNSVVLMGVVQSIEAMPVASSASSQASMGKSKYFK
jgi:translation elongation factor EF-1alpha